MKLDLRPLTPQTWPDLEALFARPGGGVVRSCWCMYYRESGEVPAVPGLSQAARRKAALRSLVDRGIIPGLIGYRQGQPIGWVSLGPREDYAKLKRSPIMKAVDEEPVWSVVCFYVDAAARGQGAAEALLKAAVAWAREQNVKLLESYPIDRGDRTRDESMWFGTKRMFDEAGFTEVARRKPTRPVMRKRLRPAAARAD